MNLFFKMVIYRLCFNGTLNFYPSFHSSLQSELRTTQHGCTGLEESGQTALHNLTNIMTMEPIERALRKAFNTCMQYSEHCYNLLHSPIFTEYKRFVRNYLKLSSFFKHCILKFFLHVTNVKAR